MLQYVMLRLHQLRTRDEGQGMVEYALILALISVVAIAVLITLGDDIKAVFTDVERDIDGGTKAPDT